MDLVADAVDRETASLFSPETAWERHAIPVRVDGDQVVVAVEHPTDEEGLEALRGLVGCDVRFAVATRSTILRAVGSVYDEVGSAPSASSVSPPAPGPAPAAGVPAVSPLPELETDAPEPVLEEPSVPAFEAAPLADVTPLRTAAPAQSSTESVPDPQESEQPPLAEPVVEPVEPEASVVLASAEPVAAEVPETPAPAAYDPPPITAAHEPSAPVVSEPVVSEPVVSEPVFAQGNVPEESSAGLAEQAPEPAPLVFVVRPAPAPEVSVEEPAPEPEAPTADVSVAPETAPPGGVPEPAGST